MLRHVAYVTARRDTADRHAEFAAFAPVHIRDLDMVPTAEPQLPPGPLLGVYPLLMYSTDIIPCYRFVVTRRVIPAPASIV